VDEFQRDLSIVLERLDENADERTRGKLKILKDRLVRLHEEKVVKINHSIMELVCAKHLILKGYEVNAEHLIEGGLICDLHGVKGYGTFIVEIETGFVPPEHALDPITYCKARIASKIARYSNYTNKFGLGTPPYYIMQIPPVFTKSPRNRSLKELEEIKNLCDTYYKNPPVSLDEIRNARLHAIYIINVEEAAVKEMDPGTYSENTIHWRY
jgi:hypothetical protein